MATSQYMATFRKEDVARQWAADAEAESTTGSTFEVLPHVRPGTKRPVFQVWANRAD